MNISNFATKPQLQEIVLDDADLVESYGEPIKFWMLDFVGINTYFDFYKNQSNNEGEQLMGVLRKIILNSEGNPAIADDEILPIDITLNVIVKVNEQLGKSKTKLSTQKNGTQSE
jgi:hypothetical protein